MSKKSPLNTALFYGFSERGKLTSDPKDEKHAKKIWPNEINASDKITLVRNYFEKTFADFTPPVSLYKIQNKKGLSLDILGSDKSIADAITIEATFAILSDVYKKENLLLEINSIGDKDSIIKFTKDLSNFYYKKNWESVPKSLRATIRKNIFEACNENIEGLDELKERAPKPIGSLTEDSRKHFKQVLEYIEALEIPYIINHDLIGTPTFNTETVLRISELDAKKNVKKVLAVGGRYNQIARKVFNKKDVPAFGININLPLVIQKVSKVNYKIFFIQLGFEAKCKSLKILENLRKENIPVFQSLGIDKISSQILQAEKMDVPFVIIMGRKEAIDNCVVVRNSKTRSQQTVEIKDLVKYLKKLL